jgi:homoserine O-acetyltransferase
MSKQVSCDRKAVNIGSFPLESGKRLVEVQIAYEIAGEVSSRKDNVILVCYVLTGDTHTVGDEKHPGWLDDLIGPGGYIDTRQYAVITMNALGEWYGSTQPDDWGPLWKSVSQREHP